MDLYFEVDPYKCTAIARSLSLSEAPARTATAILEKTTVLGKKIIAVRLDQWHGPEIKVDQSVLIGQDTRSEHFFPVTKAPFGGYVISPEMAQVIKDGENVLSAYKK